MVRFLLCLFAFAVSCEGFRHSRQIRNKIGFFLPENKIGAKRPQLPSLSPSLCGTPAFVAIDFTTTAPPERIFKAFREMNVFFACKVSGGNRYLVVVQKRSNTSLDSLNLPEDAQKSLVTFPVVKASDFVHILGLKTEFTLPAADSLPEDLMLTTTVWEADGMNDAQFKTTLTGFFHQLQKNPKFMDSFVMVTNSQLPMKVMIARRIDCSLSKNLVDIADPLGGPGCVKMGTTLVKRMDLKRLQ